MTRLPDSFEPGDRVRLRPSQRADLVDLALTGRVASVDRVEEGFDGRTYVVVVLEGDPGRDLGTMSQLGHRFFFGPEELERLETSDEPERVLIASLGDTFATDGKFGEEVTRRLRERPLPLGVHVADFGIRVADLVDVVREGYGLVVVVSTRHSELACGSLRVAALPELADEDVRPAFLRDAIGKISSLCSRSWLVTCNAASNRCHDDDRLSPNVAESVDEALRSVASILEKAPEKNSTVGR